MKKFYAFAAAALMMAACQNNPNAYTVSGVIEGAQDGDTVQLSLPQGRNLEAFNTGVVKDGKYTITGTTDTCQMAMLVVAGQPKARLFVEPGKITADIREEEETQATGSNNNDRMNAFDAMLQSVYEEYAELGQKVDSAATEEEAESLKAQMAEVEKKFDESIKTSVTDNADSEFGLFLLQQYSYNFEADELAPILEAYATNFPTNESVQKMKENNDLVLSTSEGKPFVDFEMNDPEGNPVKLSQFIAENQVTLVDFWASWCGPCRAEMPAVKAAYDAFHDKGFGIVGVSLDNDGDAWKEAIESLGIVWPQMSDLKGWDCAGAALYGVRAIPATVLVGQDGTIIARNLRGEAIAEKLAELLN